MRNQINVTAATEIANFVDSHELLWDLYSTGEISREEYHYRTTRLLDKNKTQSTGTGHLYIVDPETLVATEV